MKRLLSLLLLAALLLVGCGSLPEVVVVTATPRPAATVTSTAAPTATPDVTTTVKPQPSETPTSTLTPTSEPVFTPTSVVQYFYPVNPNPNLNGPMRHEQYGNPPRNVSIPAQFIYRATLGNANTHPDVFYKPDEGGYRFELAYRNGRFGYEFFLTSGILHPNVRYAIVVEYMADIRPKTVVAFMRGLVIDGDSDIVTLPRQPVVDGAGEAQWIVQTSDSWQSAAVRVQVELPYASALDRSALVFREIRMVPVPSDYRSANEVISF